MLSPLKGDSAGRYFKFIPIDEKNMKEIVIGHTIIRLPYPSNSYFEQGENSPLYLVIKDLTELYVGGDRVENIQKTYENQKLVLS